MRIPIALSLLLSTSALLPAAHTPELELFPVPTVGLSVPANEPDGWSLEELLTEYGRATDQHFMYAEDTRAQLKQTRVPLSEALSVDPENLHAVVETLMIQSHFIFAIERVANPRLISVQSMRGSRVNLRQSASYVPVDKLSTWRDHPAYLIHTVLTLEYLDVRTLTNSMRAMLTDANTQQIIPVGNSHSLMLTGFAPQVQSLVTMLLDVNEASRVSFEKRAKAEAKTETEEG